MLGVRVSLSQSRRMLKIVVHVCWLLEQKRRLGQVEWILVRLTRLLCLAQVFCGGGAINCCLGEVGQDAIYLIFKF
jgi:hypothetical protein